MTGGIASGKTTVAHLFEKAGIAVIDADQITRQLTELGGAAHDLILKRFGTTDRAELRKIIFKDPKAKNDLEAILHPLVHQESMKKISELGDRIVLYDAALLVETGRYSDFRGLIVVHASRQKRLERLINRDHCSLELAEKILNSQVSDEKRLAAATHVLDNSGTFQELESQVVKLADWLNQQ